MVPAMRAGITIRWENELWQHEGQAPTASGRAFRPAVAGWQHRLWRIWGQTGCTNDIASGGSFPHEAQPWIQVHSRAGPRHFAFHPNGRWLYLVAELEKFLLVYSYEPHESVLRPAGEYSLQGGNCPPEALAADVHLTGTEICMPRSGVGPHFGFR